MKRLYILLLGALLLTGCSKKVLFDEQHDFANHTWNRFTPEVFNIDVDNVEDYYNIDLTIAVDALLYNQAVRPLTLNHYSPNGDRRMFYSSIALKKNGRWQGTDHQGIRVVTERIRAFFSFNNEGSHRLEIGQATSKYDLRGMVSLNAYVERAKLDYDDL